MNRMMFLVGVIAVSILLFAPAATAQNYSGGDGTKAKSNANAAAKAPGRQDFRKIRTGGPQLVVPAALLLIGSGAAATAIVRRHIYS